MASRDQTANCREICTLQDAADRPNDISLLLRRKSMTVAKRILSRGKLFELLEPSTRTDARTLKKLRLREHEGVAVRGAGR